MKQRLSCVLLALMLVFSLSACGTVTKKKTTTATTSSSAGQSAANKTEKNDSAASDTGLKEEPVTDIGDDLAEPDILDPADGQSQVNEDGVLDSRGEEQDMTGSRDKDTAKTEENSAENAADTVKEKTKVVTKSKTR